MATAVNNKRLFHQLCGQRKVEVVGIEQSVVPADEQPPEGVPVGGARTLEIEASGATAWRAVFTLSL